MVQVSRSVQVIAGMVGSFDWRIFFETIGLLHDQLDANMTRTPVVQDMSLHNVSSADPPAVRVLDVLFFRRLGTPPSAARMLYST